MNRKNPKTAQDIQDEIFRKMSPDKKIGLASAISGLILRINSSGKNQTDRKHLAKWAMEELEQYYQGKIKLQRQNGLKYSQQKKF